MARPKKEVDPETVVKLASIGCSMREIAMVVGVSTSTISRRFQNEYEEGRANLNVRLRKKQVEIALAGNTTMLIWLGKQLLDQSDKQENRNFNNEQVQVTIGGGPLPVDGDEAHGEDPDQP